MINFFNPLPPGIDQDNLMQYIDMAPALTTDATSLSMKGDVSLTGSKGGGRQQQEGNISASSSLHVTIGSEVSSADLSEVAAASMLAGEGEGANENGGTMLLNYSFIFSSHPLFFSHSLSVCLSVFLFISLSLLHILSLFFLPPFLLSPSSFFGYLNFHISMCSLSPFSLSLSASSPEQ